MPRYDYLCSRCGTAREVRQSVTAPAPDCPDCGSSMQRLILHAPAVHGHMARGREAAVRSLPETTHGKGCPCCS